MQRHRRKAPPRNPYEVEALAGQPAIAAVGYVRVSTGKQAMSPAAQEERIRATVKAQNCRLVEIVTDTESAKEGSIRQRLGIRRIGALIEAHQVQRIIIAKLDRLTRSVVDLGELLAYLERKDVSLVSAGETWMDTGSAVGRMVVNIITCVAQWELEAISERTTAVLQHKRGQKLAYNAVPYGYRAAGTPREGKMFAGMHLVQNQAEQAIIARMRQLRKAGRTYKKIAEMFNKEKIQTKGRRRGGKVQRGKWHPATVRDILTREAEMLPSAASMPKATVH